jgi:hypothetical protein
VRHGEEASLVLADGSVHQGYSFGANVSIAGEVVFNTGRVAVAALTRNAAPPTQSAVWCGAQGWWGIRRR